MMCNKQLAEKNDSDLVSNHFFRLLLNQEQMVSDVETHPDIGDFHVVDR